MTDESLPSLPPSYFDTGEPKSNTSPGDPYRELIHEVRNLNTGLDILRHIFQQMLPALEALEHLDVNLKSALETSSSQAEPALDQTEGRQGD